MRISARLRTYSSVREDVLGGAAARGLRGTPDPIVLPL